jgi:glucose-6-phosphate 1-epimerase
MGIFYWDLSGRTNAARVIRRLGDFGDDEYSGMVCVETTNAADDVVLVSPGGEHCLEAMIGLSQVTN